MLLSGTYIDLTGTAGPDFFTVGLDATFATLDVWRDVPTTAQPTASVPVGQVAGINLNGDGGGDSLTINETNGDPIAGVPLAFYAQPSTSTVSLNTVTVIDPAGAALMPDPADGTVQITDSNGINDTISVSNIDAYTMHAADNALTLTDLPDGTAQVDTNSGANVVVSSDGEGYTIVNDDQGLAMYFQTGSVSSADVEVGQSGSVSVDFGGPNDPLPSGGLYADAGHVLVSVDDGSDTLTTSSTATANSVVFSNADVTSAPIYFPAATPLTANNAYPGTTLLAQSGFVYVSPDAEGVSPAVNIAAGATVFLDGTQYLPSLDIQPGGLARVLQNGSTVITVGTFDLEPATDEMPGGILDVSDNDLIVQTDDINNADGADGTLATVNGWVAAGYDSGIFDDGNSAGPAPAAIVSVVSAKITTTYTAIGVLGVGDDGSGLLQPGLFDGVPVVPGDVVCRYTYAGDVNLNGYVNSTDESLIGTDIDQYAADPVTDPTWGEGALSYLEYSPTVVGSPDQNLVDSTLFSAANALPPATEGQPYTFELPASADSEDVQNYSLGSVTYTSWTIDFGDGTPPQTFYPNSSGAFDPVTHDYGPAGMYDVSMRATAIDSGGNYVSVVHPHQDLVVTPDVPTDLTTTPSGTGAIELGWSDDTAVATGYEVTVTIAGGTGPFTYFSTTTSLDIGPVSTGEAFTFSVQAVNVLADGNSAASAAAATAAAVIPFTITPESSTQVYAQWGSTQPGSNGFDAYEIAAATSPASAFTVVAAEDSGSGVLVAQLAPGTTYDFRIYAYNAAGSYLSTCTATATTPSSMTIAHTASGGFVATSTLSGVDYNWSESFAGDTTTTTGTSTETTLSLGQPASGFLSLTVEASLSGAPDGAFDSVTWYNDGPDIVLTGTPGNDAYSISHPNATSPYIITGGVSPIPPFYAPYGIGLTLYGRGGDDTLTVGSGADVTLQDTPSSGDGTNLTENGSGDFSVVGGPSPLFTYPPPSGLSLPPPSPATYAVTPSSGAGDTFAPQATPAIGRGDRPLPAAEKPRSQFP
jgi:hypothetical protein